MEYTGIALLACVASLVGGLSASARESVDRAQLAELEAKVGTMYLVRRLGLSQEQKDNLLGVRKKISPAAAEYLRRRQAWRKSTAKAVRDFVEFSTRTGEFPPKEIQDGLWKYDGEWQAMPRDFVRQVGPATEYFGGSLSPRQATVLKETAREKWRFVGAQYIFFALSREDETDADSSPELRAAAISHRVKVGSLTRAGYLCAAPYLEEALGTASPDFPHWWDMEEEIAQQKRIGITHTLTFFTSLSLDREQLEEIVGCLRRHLPRTGRVTAYGEDVETREGKAYARALARAAKALEKGRSFNTEDMEALREAKRIWLESQGKASVSPTGIAKRRKAVEEICQVVRETLKESQTARMLVTNDCPIPSQAVLGVARAGQVASDRIAEIGRILDDVRKRTDWDTPASEVWWRQQVVKLSGGRHGLQRMSDDEKASNYAKATATARAIREMDAATYLAKRESICTDLMALNLTQAHFQAILQGSESDEGKRKLLAQKVHRFFVGVGPTLLTLAEARLEHMPAYTGQR